MTLLPIIGRELRSQARQPGTYAFRVAGVVVLLVAAEEFWARHGLGRSSGGDLFSHLHVAMFCSIWILVPLMSADCLSREKREGTLGLLFLTPLRAREIVLAKGLVHGLRALMLWLAVLPVLTLPSLVGGVSWREAAWSTMINFSCVCWALAAGLLGSALGKAWVRSMLFGCLASLLGVGAFMYCLGVVLVFFLARFGAFFRQSTINPWDYERMMAQGFFGATGVNHSWPSILALIRPAEQGNLLAVIAITALFSALVLWLAILLAATLIRRGWREASLPAWWQQGEAALSTPVLGRDFLRRWQLRALERNPVGWLERRTWSGRLVTWAWLAAVLTITLFLLAADWPPLAFDWCGRWLLVLLLGNLAASAAGSFRRERESGLMELLLVTPLDEREIIRGRLKEVWSQFLPALVLLSIVWSWMAAVYHLPGIFSHLTSVLLSFVTLPVVGLYFSLRSRHFLAAWLLTLLVGAAIPEFGQMVGDWWPGILQYWPVTDNFRYFGTVLAGHLGWLLQLLLALWFWQRLLRDLRTRHFPMERGVA